MRSKASNLPLADFAPTTNFNALPYQRGEFRTQFLHKLVIRAYRSRIASLRNSTLLIPRLRSPCAPRIFNRLPTAEYNPCTLGRPVLWGGQASRREANTTRNAKRLRTCHRHFPGAVSSQSRSMTCRHIGVACAIPQTYQIPGEKEPSYVLRTQLDSSGKYGYYVLVSHSSRKSVVSEGMC